MESAVANIRTSQKKGNSLTSRTNIQTQEGPFFVTGSSTLRGSRFFKNDTVFGLSAVRVPKDLQTCSYCPDIAERDGQALTL